jgi:hypothetical protein
MRLAETHPDWALGFEDETWWSRLAQPQWQAWTEDEPPLRLLELDRPKDDPDPKALCCYGLWLPLEQEMLLRFVAGRPVSQVTEDFLAWACERLAAAGKKALLLVWDNASWHTSGRVRTWIKTQNRRVKKEGGVRIVVCRLPIKAPWLNVIEPKGVHGKRAIAEPQRLLSAVEVETRVWDHYGCPREERLKQATSAKKRKKVA